jgi:hypothetical protein
MLAHKFQWLPEQVGRLTVYQALVLVRDKGPRPGPGGRR